jgi:2-polyprenyl-3-methyl-5-hydroxy-6-metoxy-1,4-benzoquinol methylase
MAHEVAREYWRNCSNTFITNKEYYEKCESVLDREVLPRLNRPDSTLDAGCGNGRFTLLLARASKRVDAFDLSPALISEAQAAAKARDCRNIHFWVGDLVDLRQRLDRYDVVACMGVISTIVDEWALQRAVGALSRATKPGGILLLRDSVSLLPDGQLVESSDYATRYRNVESYRRVFEELNFQLMLEIPLVEFGTSRNGFFLYRSAAARPEKFRV